MARSNVIPPDVTGAERLAGRRVVFVGHALVWALGCLLLFVVSSFYPTLIVALAWGIGLACHGYFVVLAPELRREWTHREIERSAPSPATGDRGRARALEQLSASIAHEIRNPVTAAKSLVQQMRDDPASPDNTEYARVALEELDRVERAISHLLRYAREEELRIETIELAAVVHAALEHLAERRARTLAELDLDIDGSATLEADADKLRRVVENLVGNALDALDERPGNEPRIAISAGTNLAGDRVWLRVRDNGPGIEPERLERIWSPFHTSKPSGTGLGLAISKKLVEAHGGTLEASSDGKTGTEFVATLPARGAGA